MDKEEFLLHCMLQNYLDIKSFIAAPTTTPELKKKLLTLLLNQGLTHASKDGLFSDFYLRDGVHENIDDQSFSLLDEAVRPLQYLAQDNELYLPIIEKSSAAMILANMRAARPNFKFELVVVTLDKQEIACIKITSKDKIDKSSNAYAMRELLREIGCLGSIPTKDALLALNVNQELLDSENFPDGCEKFLMAVGLRFNLMPDDLTDYIAKMQVSRHVLEKNHKPISAIKSQLATNLKEIHPQLDLLETYDFYWQYIAILFNGLDLDHSLAKVKESEHDLIVAALLRMEYKLAYALENVWDYASFIVAIEAVTDEITFILMMLNKYSQLEVFKSLRTSLTQLITHEPDNIILTGSCMQAISLNFFNALKYFENKNKSANNQVGIFVNAGLYYEIPLALQVGLQHPDENSLITCVSTSLPKISKYNNEIAEIMLVACNDNISFAKKGFGSHDVVQIIKNQLNLREQKESSQQLVVIIDSTMNSLDEVELNLLLEVYKKQIQDGLLAIVFAHSLNKYCQIGVDRLSAGMSIGFYNKEKFASFAQNEDRFIGFTAADITPQHVTHLFKHSLGSLAEYCSLVRGVSAFIHDKIVPADLYAETSVINIDHAYTNDLYKNPWSFLVIRMDKLAFDSQVASYAATAVGELLKVLGINTRDGYAYSETTSCMLEIRSKHLIHRISLGPDANPKKFELLMQYLQELNNQLSKPDLLSASTRNVQNIQNIFKITTDNYCNESLLRFPVKAHVLPLQT